MRKCDQNGILGRPSFDKYVEKTINKFGRKKIVIKIDYKVFKSTSNM